MDATTLGNLGQDVAAANEGQLRLSIAGVNTDDVTFLSFDSESHSLSSDYRFNFMLELATTLDLTKVIGSAAYFEVMDNSEPVYIHGIITEATYLGARTDGETYYISMNSMLYPLKHNIQNRVYLNKQVKQIVQEVLEDAQFNNAEFEFKTQLDYPVREFTVQYDESDYEFIQRLLAYEGLFFTFEQKTDGAKLIIYDNIADVPAFELGELTYETQSGQVRSMQTIYTFNRQSQMITDNVKFKDYNYRTPEANLEANASRSTNVSGQGTEYRYGENYKTLDDGDRIAKLRQEALDWPREVYLADTNCRALVPGQKFTLTNHPNESLNGDYYIVCIDHKGDQSGALAYGSLVSGMLYKSQLTLVKAGIPYRTRIPERRYKHGVFTAKVETTGGDYAYLDEQGRYHVRMPFDLSMQPEGGASHPVRQAQTYSGMEYGMHFPLHAGTEVILTCVNGDVDRPIMLGALHNPELPNLITSNNNSNNLLRSWGDNELLMEDRKGEERIDLFTRERKNSLKLDAKASGHKVYLGTEEGEMEQYAAKTMLIESGDTQTIQSGNDHILTVENSHSLHTEKKQIEHKAKTDIRFKAGKNINLSSETENVEIKAGKDMVIDVNNNMSLEVRNKNLNIVCKNGNFEIKAAKAITVKGQGGGNITVSQAGGSVVIDTGGAIQIKGTTVNIDGNAVYLKGATAKEGGGGSGGGASGSEGGSDISKLSLAALDVFNHVVRQAQDIAATINSSFTKEEITNEDLTVESASAESAEVKQTEDAAKPAIAADNVEKKKARKVLVRSVSGPEKVKVGEEAKYTVTKFNLTDVTTEEKSKIKWKIKRENGSMEDLAGNGESITIKYGEKYDLENVTVMPYVNSPTEKISVETTVGQQVYFGKKVNKEFKKRAIEVAENLGVNVDYLMTIIAFETIETFSPKIRNPDSGATGLIQFIPMVAKEYDTTVDELAKMSAVEQFDYVEKYFKKKGVSNSLEDLYMAVLWPIAVGKDNSYVLFKEGSREYKQNSGLDVDKNGEITKSEVSAKIHQKYKRGEKLKG